ncbi:MAG: putative LPS assembly protein LptD [Bacteroidota bacterium]|nr:putative LPS assembly protein LptD [Bacteroidota bacterium]
MQVNIPLNDSIITSEQDLFTKDSITKTKSDNVIETQVIYNAKDSIVLSRDQKKVYLYKEAQIKYGDVVLEADFIEYDQEKNVVFARGVEDSTGTLVGKPVFTEKTDKFEAKTIKYNFQTKKGYIEEVFTEEEQGYLHSELTKKLDDNNFLMKNGKYTTCDDPDHPHFYLSISKAKVIPGEKIISGYSYLVLEDLPLYFIGIPFGYFSSQNEQSSGIIIPAYGEDNSLGFFLRDGGYYFGISDKMDLSITGEFYSLGTWGTDLNYRFKKRYKFSSNLSASYKETVKSEQGLPDYFKSNDFSIRWSHTQDPKANPTTSFNASVNFNSSSYDKLHSRDVQDLNRNTKNSSISFSKSWPGTPFRLNADLRGSQNSKTNNVDLTLPVITFDMSRQYPFRRKNPSGKTKWYEDIEVQYSSKLENKISTKDSLLFTDTKFSDFKNGFQHNIPVSTNFKLLKHFNLSPRLQYTGILYPNYVHRYWDPNYYNEDKDTYGAVITDTISEIKYAQLFEPSISLSVGPNIYGTFRSKNPESKIIALRHVLTPSASISYRPDMGNMVSQYYDTYKIFQGGEYKEIEYSKFDNGLYRFPSAPGQNGTISLGLNNNLEMKVRNDKDTSNTEKKVKLLESLRFSSGYDIFADSLHWNPITISGRTALLENKIKINFGATVNPYAINEDGNVYNAFEWSKSGNIGRLTRADFSLDFSFKSSEKGESENSNASGTSMFDEEYYQNPDMADYQQQITNYVDFDIPWNFSANYKFVFSKPEHESKVTQTLSVSGDFSLTPKWKISFRTNYDLTENELSTTSINIHRDLHCWEMRLSWIPVGLRQSYSFQINVKASTLRDFLKLPKRKSWYDNL